MKFAALEGQRVAVWGAGREGRAALAALARRLPDQTVTLLCSSKEARAFGVGAGDPGPGTGKSSEWPGDVLLPRQLSIDTVEPGAGVLASFDVVIKSPGISAYKPEILAAREQGTLFTSGTALWFGENPDVRVIGVTGSKGKSTTAAMIAHLARSLGIRTALAGNIGLPLLELDGEKADLWVVELSSFQTGEAGPLDVGVVTSLFPEHLDWHGSVERYLADKLKLADVSRALLVNAEQPEFLARTAAHAGRELFGDAEGWHLDDMACSSFPRRREAGDSVPAKTKPLDPRLRGSDEWLICRGNNRIIEASILPMAGRHNALNACAALAALELAGFDAVAAAPALADFRPLPHRLQNLGTRDGRVWIDDSISTTPQAVLAAIESLPLRPLGVIVGGHDRGLDWSDLAARVRSMNALHFVVQGENAMRIAAAFEGVGMHFDRGSTLADAVHLARAEIPADGAVVLSPGAPSFDQFRDYTERGRSFAQLAGFTPAPDGQIPGVGIA